MAFTSETGIDEEIGGKKKHICSIKGHSELSGLHQPWMEDIWNHQNSSKSWLPGQSQQ